MRTIGPSIELWELTKGNPSIDPADLLCAVTDKLFEQQPDFRTQLLLRESLVVLENRWGRDALIRRLDSVVVGKAMALLETEMGETGFPTLEARVKERTDAQTVLDFLRDLGDESKQSARLEIGGSTALILRDLVRRSTDDIDVVNEVPRNIRENHALMNTLSNRHGLSLTHFQSRYLPDGYDKRLQYLGRFGMVDVYLVDPLDIFLGKLCSRREKDLNDLRTLRPHFAMDSILDRLRIATDRLFSDPRFRENAERNWYLLYGQSLP